MAIDVRKERIISLLNRDFKSFKRDMITYSKAYATASFTDFNESSPGMTFMEFSAYVGDGLNYYIDQAFNESGDGATQLKNVQANAKMRGYRPQGKRASVGTLSWAIQVPAAVDSFGRVVPDDSFTPVLLKGSQAVAKNGTIFETLDDVYFTASLGRQVTGSQFDPVTGVPTYFAIQKSVDVVAGQTVTETFAVTDFQQFRRIDLGQPDVIEVISVFDSSGNEWFEVDFLAQDWVFVAQTNENSDSDVVPYVLKLQSAPYRFVVDRDITTGTSTLVFGSGDGVSFDDELIPNVASYALPLAGRRTFNSFSIDPQNFLKTRSLGLSPHNTTLTVTYRVGGGSESNVPARSVRQVSSANFSWSATNLDPLKKGIVEGSVGCMNPIAMTGGGPAETIREIKANAAAFYASQNRSVTREDIVARSLSMPAKFGRPEKVFVKPSTVGRFAYDIHVLSLDVDGNLAQATPALKSNLATYTRKFKMLTDGVNILDADILDIRVHFGVTVASGKNRSEVLLNCTQVLADYFAQERMQIGQPIVVSEVISIIDSVPGVISVYELSFSNVFGVTDGLSYSDTRFNIADNLRDGMLICPSEAIFQVKYPNRDIVGSAR
ncbi:MAG TPA: hypothetical protein VFT74_19095 [Isosphaeraceae bacterium]|nr:hypothetical protein [Isosphaeraceae bacterium]